MANPRPQPTASSSRPGPARASSSSTGQTATASSSKRAGSRPSYRPDPVDEDDEEDDFRPSGQRRIKLKFRHHDSSSDDDDDPTSKLPFGGVLTETEADTSRSKISHDDKARFEKSIQAAEVSPPPDPTNGRPSRARQD